MAPRTSAERKAAALDKLEHDSDAWVATASARGAPHLVPLSLAWDGTQVIVTTEARSITALNGSETRIARLALGHTNDVVIIDAHVDVIPAKEVDPSTADTFSGRAGWDPRPLDGDWVFLLMRPQRVQVWRDVEEITGRAVMRKGAWLA